MAKTSLLPGFRFHPTDVELVWYYLKRKIMRKPFRFEAISEVELYKFAPWDLPEKSCLKSKDLEWYFFCPRDRKYTNGSRRNRANDIGFWKTTGRDRSVVHNSRTVGMKRTLVFHTGKAPRGTRTDWVMYEFRLEDEELANAGVGQDAYVLCKIFHKSGPGPKNGEQYGAPFNEEEWEDDSDTEHAVSFHSVDSSEPLDDHEEPPQSVFEVGEPSSTRNLSEAVEPSSMPHISEVSEPSSAPGLTYADGMLLELLEELLNDSPMHSGNAHNSEVLDSEHEDLKEVSSSEVEGIFNGLDDFSDLVPLDPYDGIHNLNDIDSDYSLHHALPEFSDEHYLEFADFGFLDEINPFELFGGPNDMHYPFMNHLNFQGLNNIFADSTVPPSIASNPPVRGPDLVTGQLQSTSEVPGLAVKEEKF